MCALKFLDFSRWNDRWNCFSRFHWEHSSSRHWLEEPFVDKEFPILTVRLGLIELSFTCVTPNRSGYQMRERARERLHVSCQRAGGSSSLEEHGKFRAFRSGNSDQHQCTEFTLTHLRRISMHTYNLFFVPLYSSSNLCGNAVCWEI